MRAWLLVGLVSLSGCGSQTPRPSGEPPRVGDAAASQAAYEAYCGMCQNAETCCLRAQDFAPERWSSKSGTYLRALRDYYECQRGAVLDHAFYQPAPLVPSDGFGSLTHAGNTRASCYHHACGDYAEIMVAELDKALATPRPHPSGALVSCSLPDGR